MRKIVRNTTGQTSSSREETMEENVSKFGLFDYEDHQMNYNNLVGRSIHPEDVVDWEFLSNKGLAQSFFNSINTDTFSEPQLVNLFQINKPIFYELVREFFASFEFDASSCRYKALYKDVTFRLGGVEREMSLLEFGWRVGLYFKRESRDVATLSVKSIRDLRIKLGHRCITMTIIGRKETTNRVTKIDLFYLYCIFGEGVVCNILYWLTKYLKGIRDKSVIFKGMFVTKIAWSFGLLIEKMPVTKGVIEEDKGDDEEGDGEGGSKGVGDSKNIYQNMSVGDWYLIVPFQVFSIWKAFRGNAHYLGSFREETVKITNQHQDSLRFKDSDPGDGITIYTRCRHTSSSDSVTTSLVGVSPNRHNSDLEDSIV
nr:hypothetical protein [Tanacetum cinerariifolium]